MFTHVAKDRIRGFILILKNILESKKISFLPHSGCGQGHGERSR